jgi:hypothetical protein
VWPGQGKNHHQKKIFADVESELTHALFLSITAFEASCRLELTRLYALAMTASGRWLSVCPYSTEIDTERAYTIAT